MRGKFIVVEGPDGSGKSTLAGSLTDALNERGVDCVNLREPGGTPLSEEIRQLLKQDRADLKIGARAETLLFVAARAQLVEECIAPMLAQGKWVICDRWSQSTEIYQGRARGLGQASVASVNAWATGDIHPDLVLLLTVPSELSYQRRLDRDGANLDRFDKESEKFWHEIEEGYGELLNQGGIYPIDASHAPEKALEEALRAVEPLGVLTPGN